MKNCLVICALGEDRPGLAKDLSRVIWECDCSILSSRMTVLGSEFAMILMVQGNWNTLAKLEVQLKRFEQAQDIRVVVRRTEERKRPRHALPYAVEVISVDQPGIIHGLADFFATRGITIEDLATHSYQAPHTGTPMFAVNIAIGVPADMHIAMLREEFMDFCDEHNLDAIMEPIKG